MTDIEILQVEDHFHIDHQYLIVTPLFELPDGFKPISADFKIERPDGSIEIRSGVLEAAHFLLTSGHSRYAVQLRFVGADKSDIPIGSKLYANCSAVLKLCLTPNKARNQDAAKAAPIL